MTKEELKQEIERLPDEALEQIMIRISKGHEDRWLLPKSAQRQIGLEAGMMFVVRQAENGDLYLQREQEAEAVEKNGFLVVRSQIGDMTDIVGHERDARMSRLMRRAGL